MKTDRYIVAVEVEAVIPDADPSEACYEPGVVELLREVESRAKSGDVEWLKNHGKRICSYFCRDVDVDMCTRR